MVPPYITVPPHRSASLELFKTYLEEDTGTGGRPCSKLLIDRMGRAEGGANLSLQGRTEDDILLSCLGGEQ